MFLIYQESKKREREKKIFDTDKAKNTPLHLWGYLETHLKIPLLPVSHLRNDEVLAIFMIWKEPEISARLEYKGL